MLMPLCGGTYVLAREKSMYLCVCVCVFHCFNLIHIFISRQNADASEKERRHGESERQKVWDKVRGGETNPEIHRPSSYLSSANVTLFFGVHIKHTEGRGIAEEPAERQT